MDRDDPNYLIGLNRINRDMKYTGTERVQFLRHIVDQLCAGQPKKTVIRVCGTNGKGSTATMIKNVLTSSGKRVGLFTSPYLVDPLEQIIINQRKITPANFLLAEKEVQRKVTKLGYDFTNDLSEFETWFLIAIQAFIMIEVDVMILECGMGGELDATNAIDHSDFSIFTLIGMDHTKFLGNTLTEIATTKARMIRDGEQVISYSHQRPAVTQVIETIATERHAKLHIANEVDLSNVQSFGEMLQTVMLVGLNNDVMPLTIDFSGDFQAENVKTVVEWWEVYNHTQPDQLSVEALQRGIENANLKGRFQKLANGWIADGAHNLDAISGFVSVVNEYFAEQPKTIMVGFLADKDVQTCVHELQRIENATFITVTPDNPERALPSADLKQLFENEAAIQNGVNRVVDADTFANAQSIIDAKDKDEPKLVVGSFYVVRGAINFLRRRDD